MAMEGKGDLPVRGQPIKTSTRKGLFGRDKHITMKGTVYNLALSDQHATALAKALKDKPKGYVDELAVPNELRELLNSIPSGTIIKSPIIPSPLSGVFL